MVSQDESFIPSTDSFISESGDVTPEDANFMSDSCMNTMMLTSLSQSEQLITIHEQTKRNSALN